MALDPLNLTAIRQASLRLADAQDASPAMREVAALMGSLAEALVEASQSDLLAWEKFLAVFMAHHKTMLEVRDQFVSLNERIDLLEAFLPDPEGVEDGSEG